VKVTVTTSSICTKSLAAKPNAPPVAASTVSATPIPTMNRK